jgi:hypothetical protein
VTPLVALISACLVHGHRPRLRHRAFALISASARASARASASVRVQAAAVEPPRASAPPLGPAAARWLRAEAGRPTPAAAWRVPCRKPPYLLGAPRALRRFDPDLERRHPDAAPSMAAIAGLRARPTLRLPAWSAQVVAPASMRCQLARRRDGTARPRRTTARRGLADGGRASLAWPSMTQLSGQPRLLAASSVAARSSIAFRSPDLSAALTWSRMLNGSLKRR